MYIRLDGGLGNQLFIYAAGLSINKRINQKLQIIPVDKSHSRETYIHTLMGEKLVQIQPPSALNVIPQPTQFWDSFDEKDINYDLSGNENICLPKGYYQNFTPIMNVIPEIRWRILQNEFSKEKYSHIRAMPDTIFMHVRRGDYLIFGLEHPESYFINALKVIEEYNHIKNVVVLSDDIGWCRKQEPIWKQITTKRLECKDIPDTLESLYFMIQCKVGAILSVSTFGAWGAILGADENPDSVIIYPKVNLIYEKDNPDKPPMDNLYNYPKDWIPI